MSRNGRVLLIAAAVAVAVAAFVVLQSGNDDENDKSSTAESAPTATTKAPAPPPTQRITVRGGKPVGGVHKIAVTKGDTVRLIVSSPDTSQEIHVHGYDLMRDMAPGRPATFKFEASNEGVFEIELEDTTTKIASLEVGPG
jgi:FtsP/CotA-like multicopper oxidase with cupredoxin domain